MGTAIEWLMLAITAGDPTMPRIAMMQALQLETPVAAPRRKRAKVYKIVR
jgi:hypothetical protein